MLHAYMYMYMYFLMCLSSDLLENKVKVFFEKCGDGMDVPNRCMCL